MAVTESDRLALYEKMKDALGRKEATTLMDILPPTQWKDIASKDDVAALRQASKDDVAALRQEVVNLGIELRGEMAEVRNEMVGLHSEIRGEISGLRNEMIDRFAASDRKHTALLVGFALTMWLGQTATILTVVYAG